MGLFDNFRRNVDDYRETAEYYRDAIDTEETHMPRGFGFDPSVCEGCPHRVTDKAGLPCDLCGCPTARRYPLHLLKMPPSNCIRLAQHEGKK